MEQATCFHHFLLSKVFTARPKQLQREPKRRPEQLKQRTVTRSEQTGTRWGEGDVYSYL